MIKLKSGNHAGHTLFMHGLCAQLAHEVKTKYPEVELFSVHDMDYGDFDFDSEFDDYDNSGYEVLVHMAVKLPNGYILDAQNIYETESEFMNFLDKEFDTLDEFKIIKDKSEIEAMLNLQLEEIGTLNEALEKEEDCYWDFVDMYLKEIDAYIKVAVDESKGSFVNKVHESMVPIFQRYYLSGKGTNYLKIVNKYDKSVMRLILSSKYHYRKQGMIYLHIPLTANCGKSKKHKDLVSIIITPFSAYGVTKEGKLIHIYNISSDSIAKSIKIMGHTLEIVGLDLQYLEITKSMFMKYQSPLKHLK